ncbi:EXS family protein [Candida albicans]|uniref:EXS family protein n=1 Tax=Candida albicans TaxID=5476 RepID=A0A8H6F0L0_CANAX|nr:EXS family protein [Candida albicans]
MKFAESLKEGLVPEWQDQYVDYKEGKKLIKKCKKLQEETPLIVPTEPQQVYTTGAIDENNENEVEGIPPLSAKKANFTKWLNEQLMKVDDFYIEKEQDVLPSLQFLKKWRTKNKRDNQFQDEISLQIQDKADLNYAENRVRNGIVDITEGATIDSTSLEESDGESIFIPNVAAPQPPPPQTEEQLRKTRRRDYALHKQHFGVPYLYARKQLKSALLEHYRALSLLKSFKTMNRTAFRKITKKYDKALKTELMQPFMHKIDTTSYFLTSDLLDKLINHVEELYIVFFDSASTDRKHSLEKLKTIAYAINASEMRPPSFYKEFFVSGLFLGFGLPLFVLALYTVLDKTLNRDMTEGKYLLQIWAGFFLLNLTFILFAVNMAVFDKFKINYRFIFEFNIATTLNYKQFLVLPSFGFAFFTILAWFSFNNYWPSDFPGRDWPWIYFAVMLIIFFLPGNILYGNSRRWLQVALWRLLLSGLYPVEFRDFFLGDIVSSLTYTMGNISFFFCLYSHHWKGTLPGQIPSQNTCGSDKSRLMGFFSTLPSIWRFLQCIRRYMDTGDWFPHLANSMKYTITAIYYITLSIYRIDRKTQNRAVFIVFASMNSIISSIWDIVMDWSLLQSDSKNFLLRDHLFYKNPNYYYAAMITDVILRFQWVFYAFFTRQIQQSAVTSFCIASFQRYPLPYSVSNKVEKAIKKLVELRYYSKFSEQQEPNFQDYSMDFQSTSPSNVGVNASTTIDTSATTGYSAARDRDTHIDESSIPISRKTIASTELSRRKSTFKVISDRLNRAHIKDFQRRKTALQIEDDSDDDEDEDEDELSLPPIRRTATTGGSSRLTSLRETEEV